MPSDADRMIEAERNAHSYARAQGYSGPLYVVIRSMAKAVLWTWFRVRVTGIEHIPADGGVIVAPNHKNFLDPFFIGIAARRRVRFMAKIELYKGPLGWLFLRLGAFPVRRGEADAEAFDTAAAILSAGGPVRRGRSGLGADRRARVARGAGGVRTAGRQAGIDRRGAHRGRRRRWARGQTASASEPEASAPRQDRAPPAALSRGSPAPVAGAVRLALSGTITRSMRSSATARTR